MKINAFSTTRLFRLLIGLNFSAFTAASGSVVLYDSFDQGDAYLALPQLSEVTPVNLPMATERSVSITSGRSGTVTEGTTMSVEVNSGVGRLTFAASGRPLSTNPWRFLNLTVSYTGGGFRNLDGYDGFSINVNNILGIGALIIHLGTSMNIYDETTPRLALAGPGEYFVPLDRISIGPNASLESFLAVHFIFEAHSDEFAMTVDEIRLIPEPGTAVLTLAAGLVLLRNRRAKSTTALSP